MTALTLWHVPISHYAEKVRWALDVKRVAHTRRAVLGGLHPLVTYVLTRGEHQTVPVLVVGGRGIGDSTAIIAELERLAPEPALYPADPGERRRALELEEYFDEQLGPYIRRLAYHDLTNDPVALAELTFKQVPWAHRQTLEPTSRLLVTFLDRRFRVRSAARAEAAEHKVLAALDRLESELDGRRLLCGDRLSVADITAASLFYPLTFPAEGPWTPRDVPAAWAARIAPLQERPGARWVRDVYAEHRGAR
jgi:glutathione S-transferase